MIGFARRVRSLVMLEHTVFALPFAYTGLLLAMHVTDLPGDWWAFVWITAAMVAARTMAMAINRLLDAGIDAANPRTAARDIPSGRMSRGQVVGVIGAAAALLLAAVSQLDQVTWYLWPIPVGLFVIYPLTKRFTWMCHAVLGITVGMAAPAAWLAVVGTLPWIMIAMWAAVAAWVAGFDIIYATQDHEHDQTHGIHSVPARFGIPVALRITRVLHATTVLLLVVVGLSAGLGMVYMAATAVVAAVLAYENAIVSSDDLTRVNAAFFTANGVVGLVYLAGVLAAVTVG